MAGTIGMYGNGRRDVGWLALRLLVLATERSGEPPAVFVRAINDRLGKTVVSLPMLGMLGRDVGQTPADVWVTALALAGADMTMLIESLAAEGGSRSEVSDLASDDLGEPAVGPMCRIAS